MVISTTDSNNIQEQNLCYIYRHIRLDRNEVFYIGKGTNTKGKYRRAYSSDRTNPHWHNVVNKHGYEVEIVIEKLTEQEANEKEVDLILHYGRIDLGTGTLVNMTAGGEGCLGLVVSDETRKKMSGIHKGKKLSEDHKKILNQSRIGRKHTKEVKDRIGEVHKGKVLSQETKDKISEARKGTTHTEEAKNKIGNTSKGNAHNLGRKHTDEHKRKNSDSHVKRVGQYKDGNLIKEFPSIKSTKLDGFTPGNVSDCCRGKQKLHKGYEWKFL